MLLLVTATSGVSVLAAGPAGAEPSIVGVSSTVSPASVPRSRSVPAPKKLKISALRVKAPMTRLGLRSNGSLEVPQNGYSVGWYTGGPRPGQVGPAVLAGHVNWNGRLGVFRDLSKMEIGDRIRIRQRSGSIVVFQVTRVAYFSKSRFPTEMVYGNISYPGLRLITCSYHGANNLVVFARMIGSSESRR